MEDASKLVFRAVYGSSEDPRHPASNLERPIKTTNGWQSEHFCDFPQQLVLSFKDVVEVRVLQFLSHEYMIASKVVFYIGNVADEEKEPPSFHGIEWKRLGYVSLDKNDKTEYRARELKTIQFSAHHVAYLKIVLQRNHVNTKNLYNQVGIVGFRCFGSTERSFESNPHFSMPQKEPLGPTKSHSMVDQSVELAQLRPPARSAIPVREDLEFEKEFDPKTIERFRDRDALHPLLPSTHPHPMFSYHVLISCSCVIVAHSRN
jgi:centrosomal protein CEP104